jgi:hypothetical protein
VPILPDKLNALLDEQDGRAARQNALAAPQVSPDDMGRALSIAQRREQPPLVVADNLAEFDEREHLDAMEAAGKEPRLGAFLQKPEHAALAKDDLPAMGFLARTIQNLLPFQSPFGQPERRTATGVGPVSSGTRRTWGEFAGDIGLNLRVGGRSGLAALAETPQNAINAINGQFNDMASGLAAVFGQKPDSLVPAVSYDFAEKFRALTNEVNAADIARHQSFAQVGDEANRPDGALATLGYYAKNPGLAGTDAAMSGGFMAGSLVPGKAQATLVTMALQQASDAVSQAKQRLIDKGADEATAQAQAAEVFLPAFVIGVAAQKLVPGAQSGSSGMKRSATQCNRLRFVSGCRCLAKP